MLFYKEITPFYKEMSRKNHRPFDRMKSDQWMRLRKVHGP